MQYSPKLKKEKSGINNFLTVLEENYQAQIAGFYNVDKTDEERKIRNAVIEEYKDLIAIYNHKFPNHKNK